MLIGFGAPVSGSWATPANQVAIAQRAEALGYTSLWTFSRLIYSDWPEPMRLASPYRSVHDPIVVASFLAGVTERIRLGLAVVNAPFYPPIALAKALTSLDIVSGGRLDAGLGIGWSPDEYEATGTSMERRGARMSEYLRCLEEIWTGDPAEFEGEFYKVPRGWSDPKPVQQPHPPVLLGGTADAALRRAGALAQGWISSSRVEVQSLAHAIEQLRAGASGAGKDPAAVRVVIRGVARLREAPDPAAGPLTGPLDVIRAGLERYAEAGATEVFLDLNFDEEIGNPDADAARSLDIAHQVLEAFAPESAG
ncbi:MAG TPA: TIGR03619 family F420-dependent LLM class oxidoreductase [Mycobacteriales bacterium]|nr:TIGR03619 family F420-dependent LLM class oxidoreductase [Mycobacteriales bacterium]